MSQNSWQRKHNKEAMSKASFIQITVPSSQNVSELCDRIFDCWSKNAVYAATNGAKESSNPTVNLVRAMEEGIVALPKFSETLGRGERAKAGKRNQELLFLGSTLSWVVTHDKMHYIFIANGAPSKDNQLLTMKDSNRKKLLQIVLESAISSKTPLLIQEGTFGLSATDPYWDGNEYFVCENCPEQHFTDDNVFLNLIKGV